MKTRRLVPFLLALALVAGGGSTFAQSPGEFIDVFASEPAISGPAGLVVGPDGNLHVSSQSGGSVLRFDGTAGAFIDEFAGHDLAVSLERLFTPTRLP
jgi:hypothetical protein